MSGVRSERPPSGQIQMVGGTRTRASGLWESSSGCHVTLENIEKFVGEVLSLTSLWTSNWIASGAPGMASTSFQRTPAGYQGDLNMTSSYRNLLAFNQLIDNRLDTVLARIQNKQTNK